MKSDFTLVRTVVSGDKDPFADNDSADRADITTIDSELADLVKGVQGDQDQCSALDLISAESDIPVCAEFADETWEEDFIAELGPQSKHVILESDSDAEEDLNESETENVHCIKTFEEAVICLEGVPSFLEGKRYTSEATKANSLVNTVVQLQYIFSSS